MAEQQQNAATMLMQNTYSNVYFTVGVCINTEDEIGSGMSTESGLLFKYKPVMVNTSKFNWSIDISTAARECPLTIAALEFCFTIDTLTFCFCLFRFFVFFFYPFQFHSLMFYFSVGQTPPCPPSKQNKKPSLVSQLLMFLKPHMSGTDKKDKSSLLKQGRWNQKNMLVFRKMFMNIRVTCTLWERERERERMSGT